MIVEGQEVPQAAIDAGLAAMVGEFRSQDVINAIYAADKRHSSIAYRLSDRLLIKEKKAGRIGHLGGGKWRRIP